LGSGGSVEKRTTSPQDIIDYLNKLFAYALSIGMSYDQYWKEDPKLINAYIQAEEIRQRKRNNEMWLQGAYIYHAIGSLSPVLNPFSKDHKAKPYLKQPIPITEEEREQIQREKEAKFISYLDRIVEAQSKKEDTEVDK